MSAVTVSRWSPGVRPVRGRRPLARVAGARGWPAREARLGRVGGAEGLAGEGGGVEGGGAELGGGVAGVARGEVGGGGGDDRVGAAGEGEVDGVAVVGGESGASLGFVACERCHGARL